MKKQITFKELKKILTFDENTTNNDFANDICCLLIYLSEAINSNPNATEIDKNYNDKFVYHKRMKLYEKLSELGYFDDLKNK